MQVILYSMMLRTALVPTVLLLSLSACVAGTGDISECQRANLEIETCAGSPVESAFSEECTVGEARNASGLLDELERNGCEGSPEGKSDGFFCGFWDPFDWCDDPAESLGAVPSGQAARYPILLAHGFNTSTTNFWRFNDVDVALAADGHEVVLGSVPPFDSSRVRATYLADQVDELLTDTGAEKVNLVCFSQGGVDCRYLVSPGGLDYGQYVASVTTISSPHRGTNVADVAIAALPNAASRRGRIVDAISGWFGSTFSELADDSHFIAAMESMSEAAMIDFNREVIDHPEVYYQSWAGFSYVGGFANPRDSLDEVCRDDGGVLRLLAHEGKRDVMDPLLVAGAGFTGHGTQLLPNDGVSTVASAHWGVFRGCIPADHLDQVGQIRDEGANRRTGFDFIRFYRNIAYDLAAMGY